MHKRILFIRFGRVVIRNKPWKKCKAKVSIIRTTICELYPEEHQEFECDPPAPRHEPYNMNKLSFWQTLMFFWIAFRNRKSPTRQQIIEDWLPVQGGGCSAIVHVR